MLTLFCENYVSMIAPGYLNFEGNFEEIKLVFSSRKKSVLILFTFKLIEK